jgi:hypothetical protein
MRWLILIACACGGASKQPEVVEVPPAQPISVEWKLEQGEGHTVNVALVIDGTSNALGALDAATEFEAGTPATCALRAANPRRTELVCGDTSSFTAELVGREVLVTLVAADQRSEVKRIPVYGDTLAVKMLMLPYEGR